MMQFVTENVTSCHLSFSCWHLVARLLQEKSDIFGKMSHILQEKSDIFEKMSHILQEMSDIFGKMSHILQEMSHILTKTSHISENMSDISSEISIEKVGYSQISSCMAILLWELYPTKSDFTVSQTLILCENLVFFPPNYCDFHQKAILLHR